MFFKTSVWFVRVFLSVMAMSSVQLAPAIYGAQKGSKCDRFCNQNMIHLNLEASLGGFQMASLACFLLFDQLGITFLPASTY